VLRDIMSAAGLSFFAEVSLVCFFAAFIALVVFLFVTRGSPYWEAARRMPLDDDREASPDDPEGGGKS
jgi:cbb3-type cytochrome oxidase subunit 3